MFKFFKRPKGHPKAKPEGKTENEYVTMLSFDDETYAKVILRVFEKMDPATRAYVVVAYQNMVPVLSMAYMAGEKSGDEITVEKFIQEWTKDLDNPDYQDEINSRRTAWFLFAGLLGRLEKLALRNKEVKSIGAKIWCLLIPEFSRLRVLLPKNIVWTDKEKEWFKMLLMYGNYKKIIEIAINHFVPPIFAKTKLVEDFAKNHGVLYYPSDRRFGFIP